MPKKALCEYQNTGRWRCCGRALATSFCPHCGSRRKESSEITDIILYFQAHRNSAESNASRFAIEAQNYRRLLHRIEAGEVFTERMVCEFFEKPYRSVNGEDDGESHISEWKIRSDLDRTVEQEQAWKRKTQNWENWIAIISELCEKAGVKA